jgi:hypothetical protein
MAETPEKRVTRGIMLLLVGAKYLCNKINQYEVRLKPRLGPVVWAKVSLACDALDLMYEALQIYVDTQTSPE